MQATMTRPKYGEYKAQIYDAISQVQNEEELVEVRNILAHYFAAKAQKESNKLGMSDWYNDEIIEAWAHEQMSLASNDATAPCQFTVTEVKDILQQGLRDYEAGLCISQEELEAESALW